MSISPYMVRNRLKLWDLNLERFYRVNYVESQGGHLAPDIFNPHSKELKDFTFLCRNIILFSNQKIMGGKNV